jgi:hypothetical protein
MSRDRLCLLLPRNSASSLARGARCTAATGAGQPRPQQASPAAWCCQSACLTARASPAHGSAQPACCAHLPLPGPPQCPAGPSPLAGAAGPPPLVCRGRLLPVQQQRRRAGSGRAAPAHARPRGSLQEGGEGGSRRLLCLHRLNFCMASACVRVYTVCVCVFVCVCVRERERGEGEGEGICV